MRYKQAQHRMVWFSLNDGRRVCIKAYPISVLAAALGRNPHTIRLWEWNEIIPKPILRMAQPKSSQRFYLDPEIETYIRVFEESGAANGKNFKSTNFSANIRVAINKLINEIKEGKHGEIENSEP